MRYLRRAELLLAYIMTNIPEYQSVTGVSGSIFAQDHPSVDGFFDLAKGADVENGIANTYWRNSMGIFGQYYVGVLMQLGLVCPPGSTHHTYRTTTDGDKLADAFGSNIPQEKAVLFWKSIYKGNISFAELITMKEFALHTIPDGAELETYRNIIRGKDSVNYITTPTQYRIQSIKLLASFIEKGDSTIRYCVSDFLRYNFEQVISNNLQVDIVPLSWFLYEFDELAHTAFESFHFGLLYLLADDPLPLDQVLDEIEQGIKNLSEEDNISNVEDTIPPDPDQPNPGKPIPGSTTKKRETLEGTEADDTIPAETIPSGNDTLPAETVPAGQVYSGTKKADLLIDGDGDDTLIGGKGKDTLTGGNGKDFFIYANGDGNDIITDYTSGEDVISITGAAISKVATVKNTDNLLLTVGKGTISLLGAKGSPVTIIDKDGNKTTRAYGIENITIDDNSGDTINTAIDAAVRTIDASDRTIAVNIAGNTAANSIVGGSDNDSLNGGAGNDTLSGGTGSDTLVGGAGNDYIAGGYGNDKLVGDAGNDTLVAGYGNDILTGGAGKDTFILSGGSDSISDYVTGQDVIELNGIRIYSAELDTVEKVVKLTMASSISGSSKIPMAILPNELMEKRH